jgi:hypothetical protein
VLAQGPSNEHNAGPMDLHHRSALRRGTATLALAAGLLVVGACGDDTDDAGTDTTTTAPADTGATDEGALSSYAGIAELQEALTDAGITCNLEYEGLRDGDKELSICVIDGEQAYLTIWSNPADVDAFAASPEAADTVARGANWTVAVTTGETATKVADALGGATT